MIARPSCVAAGFTAAFAVAACATTALATSGLTLLHVDDDAAAGGDGATWATAFAHLTDALDTAADLGGPVEIRVAEGWYAPDRSDAVPGGTGLRWATFDVPSGVDVRGGFAGPGAPDPDLQDPAATPSILSGDLAANDVPGDAASRFDNARQVVHVVPPDVGVARLEGLTIEAGRRLSGDPDVHGIGIDADASVVIDRCIIRDHRAAEGGTPADGAGIGCAADISVEIVDTHFEACRGDAGGALVAIDSQSVVLLDVHIADCDAFLGGGVYIRETSTVTVHGGLVTRCAATVGGGLNIAYSDTVLVEDVTLHDNFANNGASAALVALNGDELVRRCTFTENFAAFVGTALEQGSAWRTSLVDACRFIRNVGVGPGPIAALTGPNAIGVTNCTFSRNAASAGVLGAFNDFPVVNCSFSHNPNGAVTTDSGQDPFLRNCIVATSGHVHTTFFGVADPDILDVRDSIVTGGYPGSNVIDVDPQYVQPGTDDLRLAEGSPALDLGDPAWLLPHMTEDIDGAPRVQGASVDLGAHEGAFEPGEPIYDLPDVDEGEFHTMTIGGGSLDMRDNPIVRLAAGSSGDDHQYTIAVLPDGDGDGEGNGSAAAYVLFGDALAATTTMTPGTYTTRLSIPFDADDLAAAGITDPFAVDLIRVDPSDGPAALAAAQNLAPAVGYDTPLADRAVLETAPPDVVQLGAWGVSWDAATGRGVAWSTPDRAGVYRLGVAVCPSDGHQPPDGTVGLLDLLLVLGAYDRGAGPWDADGNGSVGLDDIVRILSDWGVCD